MNEMSDLMTFTGSKISGSITLGCAKLVYVMYLKNLLNSSKLLTFVTKSPNLYIWKSSKYARVNLLLEIFLSVRWMKCQILMTFTGSKISGSITLGCAKLVYVMYLKNLLNSSKLLTFVTKSPNLYIWKSSKYAPVYISLGFLWQRLII